MYFTKEQYEKLYEARPHFKTALIGYVKNCPRWLTDMVADVYEEATHSTVNRNWSCSSCVFNFLNMVANMYFKDEKDYQSQLNNHNEFESDDINESKPKTYKPKTKGSHK